MSKKNYFFVLWILFVLLAINLLSFFKKDNALKLETMKVGGPENMELVTKLYQSQEYIDQQTAAIDQALAQINMADSIPNENDLLLDEDSIENENNDEIEETKNQSIIDELDNIKSSSSIYGKEDARFTILEYSELLCPYCKRHSDQLTLESVIKKFPNEVNTIFRNFIVHWQAAKLWEVIECVGELKSKSQHDFIKNSFAYEGNLSVDILVDIAWKLWVNKKTLQECIDSGKYTEAVNNQTNEWRTLFGVSWTPGNVIIDRETGKFVVVPGAYPAEKFIEEIEKLKNN